MNAVDIAIIAVIGVSALFGLYKGFIHSVMGLAGVFLALLAAYLIYPQVAKSLQNNESLIHNLIYYSDASSRIHDLELSRTPVSGISSQALDEIMARANLPRLFEDIVRGNVEGQVFAQRGNTAISEYLNETIVAVSLNILCFIACFAVAYAAVTLLNHLLGYVFRLPVLKHMDLIMGGIFGGLRGVLLVFVIFAAVPVLLTVSPIAEASQAIDESRFASIFYNANLIALIM